MIIVLGAACTAAARAQAISAETPNFAGTWTLDWYLSDSPQQVAEALRIDTGQRGDEAFGEGPQRGGTGGAGNGGRAGRGGFGGVGPGGAPGAGRSRMSAVDQKRLQELTNAVQFPPPAMTISQTATDITIAPQGGVGRTVRTDGTREKYQLAAGVVDRTATWEGPQLSVVYEIGHSGRLTYTYRVVPTTKQLLIRINFERDHTPGPFEIKLVYDPAPKA